tara:strand:+ start:33 stop:605 length:573 start_codon:yes stop_codon:yes gene_type:complete
MNKCEEAEVFWWRFFNKSEIYDKLKQECLNPEKNVPLELRKLPFIKKMLKKCKGKVTGEEADKRIELFKEKADKAFPKMLKECKDTKKNYKLTEHKRSQLIKLSGLLFMLENKFISKESFNKIYNQYKSEFSLQKKTKTEADLQKDRQDQLNLVIKYYSNKNKKSLSKSKKRVYVDNKHNRELGRVGKPY